MTPARVRFAPSPTGALHIGGLRTALYNYLLARQTGGTMILRIEDTDQTRFVPGAEDYIIKSLEWAGINIDEGPVQGGNKGPYRQSERKEIYKQFTDQLLKEGKAYYAFDSEAELEAMRERLRASGASGQQYDQSTRMQMVNSLTLSAEETARRIAEGKFVIRMKVESGKKVVLNDLIRGTVEFDSAQVDDKVLMKSDGMPTYHLANVVDDHLMEITHVIRGEEWLPSAPLHVLLYEAFGWSQSMPSFAHLPLLLKPDGNGKLSKRDADQLGFPIFPLDWTDPRTGETARGYKESGYLPDALINFLAFLGWNPGTDQEIFSMEQLIASFSLERISKSGARFDIHKAQWFNQQYIRMRSAGELARWLQSQCAQKSIPCSEEKAEKIASVLKERITFPSDLWNAGEFFFTPPTQFDLGVVSKKKTPQTEKVLDKYAIELSDKPRISDADAQALLEKVCLEEGIKTGQVLQLLRVCLTGAAGGPDLMPSISILGGIECRARINSALLKFKS
ncbi:MAG: glutamate--tRNA ligase [Bacteroidetes bacterium]|nr:glutamate--tRNA ligase [Bacteroidota bacterium]